MHEGIPICKQGSKVGETCGLGLKLEFMDCNRMGCLKSLCDLIAQLYLFELMESFTSRNGSWTFTTSKAYYCTATRSGLLVVCGRRFEATALVANIKVSSNICHRRRGA